MIAIVKKGGRHGMYAVVLRFPVGEGTFEYVAEWYNAEANAKKHAEKINQALKAV